MKIVSVVGARPQFIKAAPLSLAIRKKHYEVLVHTGQHYDENMSSVFFKELGIPQPDYHLGIGSASHGSQTGAMLKAIEKVMIDEKPDWVLVYGDTNSTLAGALAASKLNIKLAHVEAGLRSFNRNMPEEVNRVVTDHLSDLLLCPSQIAVENLAQEGIQQGVHIVGDIMADALALAIEHAERRSKILNVLGVSPKNYILSTVHRAENTDDIERMRSILSALSQIEISIVFPIHPRTRKVVEQHNLNINFPNIKLIDPVGYLDMVQLLRGARMVLTDSGGIQKEAYWLKTPCITLREETEWIETVDVGWNVLVGADSQRILQAVNNFKPLSEHIPLYGEGKTASNCLELLEKYGKNQVK